MRRAMMNIRMNTRMSVRLCVVVMTLAMHGAVWASSAIDANDLRAPRGVTGSLEIEYQPRNADSSLRAKAMRDSTAPLMARVTPLGNARYRIEYLGVVSGNYDLAALLEESDGRATSNLAALQVEIFTQLPLQHGTDVFGLANTDFGISAYYRVMLGSLIVLWCLIPIIVMIRRSLRRAPIVPVEIAVVNPNARDMLRDAVAAAGSRELTLEERARLELLLLQVLRDENATTGDGTAHDASLATLADAMTALRRNAHSAPIVLAVERWLHAHDDDASSGRNHADAALLALNAMPLRHNDVDEQLRASTNEGAT